MSSKSGEKSGAQITAFEDTWHWSEQAEQEYSDLIRQSNTDVADLLSSLKRFLHQSDMMAYLVMMTTRLLEMHKVLKPTGSLYLHCDPTASHYLKIVLDNIFGAQNYRSEIIWQRTAVKGDVRRKFGAVHDVILAYTKNENYKFNIVYREQDEEYLSRFRFDDNDGRGPYQSAPLDSPNPRPNLTYNYKDYAPSSKGWRVNLELMEQLDKDGRLIFPIDKHGRIRRKVYLSDQGGPKISDVWTDISPLQGGSIERMGYPTQKPLSLLERIIKSSSDEGDLVLDPFCGCGTAVHAAQKLGREWIGIDITHLSIHLVERRMKEAFPGIQFKVHGEPKDFDAARDLALRDKYEFQFWACSLVGAQPYKGGKKGADSGIDGIIYFQDDKATKKIIVSVKGGEHVTRTMLADLKKTVDREGAQIGLFVTLVDPTEPMRKEAIGAGYYTNPYDEQFPKIQIMTITNLMDGRKPQYRDFTQGKGSFKEAKTEKKGGEQPPLL